MLIETFAETERFTDAVYKASAWPNLYRQSPAGIRTSSNESADDTLTQIMTNHLIRAVTKETTQRIQCQSNAIVDEPPKGESSGPKSVAGVSAAWLGAAEECGLRIIVRARQASRGQRPGTAKIRAGRGEDTVNDLSSYGGGTLRLQDFTSIDLVAEKRAFQG